MNAKTFHKLLILKDDCLLVSQSPDNQLVQYAQSSSADAKPLLHDLERIADENPGTDVLFYGEELHSPTESAHDVPPPGAGWHACLPLTWYLEAADADVVSTNESFDLSGAKSPIIVALNNVSTCASEDDTAEDIDRYMDGYHRYEFQRFGFNSGCHVSDMTVYGAENELPADSTT
ncbi:hypothetical protein [Haladaptatus halobius]|uniref:hypothetical protein n=1 Tax=Haladaptatus halobius TaxID=2884875 RepID=UPI001D0AD325|nr:hypothetical protein [Haladaptatus halobius]